MCKFCDKDSSELCIFQEGLTNDWYYSHRTNQWDDYDDDFVYDRIYISYCPWCGKELDGRRDR